MQKADTTRTPPRRTSTEAGCCTDHRCDSGLRNNYFEGKRLTPDTFRTEQRYLNERRRLLNRAVHGWGVVYGYSIGLVAARSGQRAASGASIDVGAGLALDQCGRELLETGRRLTLDDLIVLDDDLRTTTLDDLLGVPQSRSKNARQQKDPPPKICALITAHYAEQSTDAVTIPGDCRCERHEWDHVCETVRYTLRIVPCESCCRDWECELCCDCGHGTCCQPPKHSEAPGTIDRPDVSSFSPRNDEGPVVAQDAVTQALASEIPRPNALAGGPHQPGAPAPAATACETLPFKRGGCECLCEHLTTLNPGEDCDGIFCEIDDPCGRQVRVDVRHGVPLACVSLDSDNCQDWCLTDVVDACGPRRLVKRNDLLFDLIRGCDLTRIVEIGWKWHRALDPVALPDFQAAFGTRGYEQPEYVTRDFWVRFSKPVLEDTLGADCFAITILSMDCDGKWWMPHRVPITRIEPIDPGEPGYVRGARIVVDGGWAEGVLWNRGSVFHEPAWVEIEVRGDFILDCNGQPIDADAVGRVPAPTGNGSPGGRFLSTFRVVPREPQPQTAVKA